MHGASVVVVDVVDVVVVVDGLTHSTFTFCVPFHIVKVSIIPRQAMVLAAANPVELGAEFVPERPLPLSNLSSNILLLLVCAKPISKESIVD